MRYAIELSYDGTPFNGWQIQKNAPNTVQQILENAFSTICKEPIKIYGCGRTDSGVHARQFVAHFDTNSSIPKNALKWLNNLLPTEIAVHKILSVDNDFHARFDATERTYKYYIHFQKNPFYTSYSLLLHQKPDLILLNKASILLVGEHDFKSFCKAPKEDMSNYVCNISVAKWELIEDQLIFTVIANRFLRNMVRALVGTLLDVGFEKMTIEEFKSVIKSGKRSSAGLSAPACGLFLNQIKYPNL